MITQQQLDRINALARKSKGEGLSEEEKQEQAQLRQAYVRAVRESLVANLEQTYILDDAGNKEKLRRKG